MFISERVKKDNKQLSLSCEEKFVFIRNVYTLEMTSYTFFFVIFSFELTPYSLFLYLYIFFSLSLTRFTLEISKQKTALFLAHNYKTNIEETKYKRDH